MASAFAGGAFITRRGGSQRFGEMLASLAVRRHAVSAIGQQAAIGSDIVDAIVDDTQVLSKR